VLRTETGVFLGNMCFCLVSIIEMGFPQHQL
jgi:hypothetical protein